MYMNDQLHASDASTPENSPLNENGWTWKGTTDIQGDSGGICTTLGNDSMSDSKQKS